MGTARDLRERRCFHIILLHVSPKLFLPQTFNIDHAPCAHEQPRDFAMLTATFSINHASFLVHMGRPETACSQPAHFMLAVEVLEAAVRDHPGMCDGLLLPSQSGSTIQAKLQADGKPKEHRTGMSHRESTCKMKAVLFRPSRQSVVVSVQDSTLKGAFTGQSALQASRLVRVAVAAMKQ